MSDIARASLRISIEASLHDAYKELVDGADIEKAPFRTMKDIFMLAASLGYRRNRRTPLSGKRQQIFHWTQFSEQVDVPILKAIAIASSRDILVLTDYEKIVLIAEEHANAGIHELLAQTKSGLNQPLWATVDLIRLM
jgi:dnd system-associated protein 4